MVCEDSDQVRVLTTSAVLILVLMEYGLRVALKKVYVNGSLS